MDVGAALRDAREQRGLSLDQLSHATKISITILRAIEHNRMDKFPDGIFLRGFLRAYAGEVGLNPEDTVRRYLGEFEPVTTIIEVTKPGTDEARAEHGSAVRGEIAERQAARVPWRFGVVVLVISLVGSYAFVRWWASAPPPALPVPRPPASAIETRGRLHLLRHQRLPRRVVLRPRPPDRTNRQGPLRPRDTGCTSTSSLSVCAGSRRPLTARASCIA